MPTKRFEEALIFACHVHAAQLRKGTEIPYISHLLGVASIVLDYGGNEDEAIAALLHDAVEDQGGSLMLEQIRSRFGETVAAIVDRCTDSYETPKPPWKQRKEAYIKHLPEAPPSALLVSAADKLHNVRAILADYRQFGEELWKRFNARREDILCYYSSLVRAFRQAGTHRPLVDELDQVVTEIKRLVQRENGQAPGRNPA